MPPQNLCDRRRSDLGIAPYDRTAVGRHPLMPPCRSRSYLARRDEGIPPYITPSCGNRFEIVDFRVYQKTILHLCRQKTILWHKSAI